MGQIFKPWCLEDYLAFCFSGMLTLVCFITEQKRKTLCYVDYDQTTVEDDAMQSAATLTWPGTATALSVQLESDMCVKRCNRESISYEDDNDAPSSHAADPLIVRGKCYNYQFDVNHAPCPENWMHTTKSARYSDDEILLLSFISLLYHAQNSRCIMT